MKIYFLFFLCMFGFIGANAQDVFSLGSPYPMTVVLKVQSISSVVSLTKERQVIFAAFFNKEEDLLSKATDANLSEHQFQQLRKQLIIEFRTLLSEAELQLFSQKRKDSEYAKLDIISSSN